MKQVILKVEDKKYEFFLELVKSLDFVQVQEDSGDSKEEIAANLSKAFKELKEYKEGKVKGIPAKELLDEI